jgi:hypothetical protein
MSLAKISPNFPKYSCESCGIFTNNKKDYTNHLMTVKHTKTASFNNLSQNIPQNLSFFPQNSVDQSINNCVKLDEKCTHICVNCNKIYKSRVGLWYHNKKCKIKTIEIINEDDFNDNLSKIESELEGKIKNNLLEKDNLIEYLIKENQEFKGLIMELIKKDHGTNNITNNNNCNNVNNSFNLNLFLNETCKDAININEFVDNIQMKLSDLENFGNLGYVEGVSRILIKNLKDLDIVKRPIHCSDLKREVLYIKNEDKWTKEEDTSPIFKSAIKQVANKNIKQIPVWRQEHPTCLDPLSKQNDVYLKIVSNSMSGGSQEEMNKNYDKIIRNISKEVTIEKNINK